MGQELTLQLLEFYPEITSYMKKIIDEQYHELSDWIAAEFDNYKNHVINSCNDKAAAEQWVS